MQSVPETCIFTLELPELAPEPRIFTLELPELAPEPGIFTLELDPEPPIFHLAAAHIPTKIWGEYPPPPPPPVLNISVKCKYF